MSASRPAALTLLNVVQLAELLGRTEASVRWMIHNGSAPESAMIAGRRMFRLEGPRGVLAWIDDQFAASAPRSA
jgi:hypothetical protein